MRSPLLPTAVLLIPFALSELSCGRAVTPDPVCDLSEKAVRGPIERIISSDNAKDLDAVLAGYTDDVVWLPPSGDALIGKDSIRARYSGLFASFRPEFSVAVEETRATGGMALVRGTTQGKLTSLESGAIQMVDDKFLAILRCEAGQWRVSHLSWNPRKVSD